MRSAASGAVDGESTSSSSESSHAGTMSSGKPRWPVAIACAQISGPGIRPDPVVDVEWRS